MARAAAVCPVRNACSWSANAALFAVAMLALHDQALADQLQAFRTGQTAAARAMTLPPV
jgi:5-(carboxyamino)imidazole ribonucleotide mutase